MALPRTIAIDGPASSGKSAVSAELARELGYLFVDTGAFYRAVTLAAIEADVLDAGEAALVNIAEHCEMDILSDRDADGREYTILLNGQDVTWNVREPAVEANVSRVSAVGGVRKILAEKQRAMAMRGPVIMVGRDIGTIVLPDADLKIYLDASPEARADRRYRQRIAAGEPADYDAILASLRARDDYDSHREVSPLRVASDAHYLHTDHLDVDGVVQALKRIILDWQPH